MKEWRVFHFNASGVSVFCKTNSIEMFDPELHSVISSEVSRQEAHIELIASENYTSQRVLEAQGSLLTNKYAEGYPGKRYYGGCNFVDIAENLAIERACKLFGARYANVQPHSGSQANAAAYLALLNPGDTILGMSLSDGGHLTHGSSVNFSGKVYKALQYGVNSDGLLDYTKIAELAEKSKPKLILGGFSAFSRIVDWQIMRSIADSVGAYFLVDMAHIAGLVAAGIYPSPIPYAHVVTSTTHKTLRGPRSGMILSNEDNLDLHKKLNSGVFPGTQGGPLMHVVAAKAICFLEAMDPTFVEYQKQVVLNARTMAKSFLNRGYKVVSGGTDNHLMLIDLIAQGISGKKAESVLEDAHITLNKNSVPNDPKSPFVTSGIRIGTSAVTTRGFEEDQCKIITNWICDILDNIDDTSITNSVRCGVADLCRQNPVY